MTISIDILLYRIEELFEVSSNIVSLGMRIDIVSRRTIRFTPLMLLQKFYEFTLSSMNIYNLINY